MEYIYGELNHVVEKIKNEYTGIPTPTIAIEVDNDKGEIKADVIKTPKTITLMVDGRNYTWDGSKDLQLVLSAQDYSELERLLHSHLENYTNPHRVTKEQVGLGNVENRTIDTTPTSGSLNYITSGGVKLYVDTFGGKIDAIYIDGVEVPIENKIVNLPAYPTKTSLGLDNVDNTSDLNKPISTSTQNALDLKADKATTYTKTETDTLLDGKVDKIVGKGLSTNDFTDAYKDKVDSNQTSITTIEEKIPSEASASNQLADKEYVNDQVNSVSAYYITKNAQGEAFATKSELTSASTYYSGGEVRTPTRNDYAIVLDDETHNDECTRYSYQNQWEYQYTVNESPMTQAQLDALNSGITSSKVSTYDGYASSKQDTLVSGTNIKTINNTSLLGSGNITTPTYTAGTGIDITNGVISLDIANGDSEGF